MRFLCRFYVTHQLIQKFDKPLFRLHLKLIKIIELMRMKIKVAQNLVLAANARFKRNQ